MFGYSIVRTEYASDREKERIAHYGHVVKLRRAEKELELLKNINTVTQQNLDRTTKDRDFYKNGIDEERGLKEASYKESVELQGKLAKANAEMATLLSTNINLMNTVDNLRYKLDQAQNSYASMAMLAKRGETKVMFGANGQALAVLTGGTDPAALLREPPVSGVDMSKGIEMPPPPANQIRAAFDSAGLTDELVAVADDVDGVKLPSKGVQAEPPKDMADRIGLHLNRKPEIIKLFEKKMAGLIKDVEDFAAGDPVLSDEELDAMEAASQFGSKTTTIDDIDMDAVRYLLHPKPTLAEKHPDLEANYGVDRFGRLYNAHAKLATMVDGMSVKASRRDFEVSTDLASLTVRLRELEKKFKVADGDVRPPGYALAAMNHAMKAAIKKKPNPWDGNNASAATWADSVDAAFSKMGDDIHKMFNAHSKLDASTNADTLSMNIRIATLETRHHRLDEIDQTVSIINRAVGKVTGRVAELENRVAKLESQHATPTYGSWGGVVQSEPPRPDTAPEPKQVARPRNLFEDYMDRTQY
jgi:hypothetical protein